MLSNFGTQVGVGWTNSDTAVYYAFDSIKHGFNTGDNEELGKGMGLLLSQLLKFEAPAAVITV